MTDTLTIGALAKRAGMGAGTLRYYETLGLLAPPVRSPSGYRLYQADDLKRLRFIRRAQELGFSLDEIAVLLALSQRSEAQAAEVKQLTVEKLADIDHRIQDLERMKQGLLALSEHCSGQGPASTCPILAALSGDGTDTSP